MTGDSNSAFLLMNERRLRGEFCDFEIRVEDEVFKVHRLVLDTRSEYFRTMFASGMMEASQQFCTEQHISVGAAKACIDYMYTSQLEVDKASVVDVLIAAHKWQVNDAVKKCEEFLKENLDLESCCQAINLSSLYDLEDLKQACHQYLRDNLEEVSKLENLDQLESEDIQELLKDTKKDAVPHLWDLCVRWIQAKSGSNWCAVVSKFPFESFSINDFCSKVWNNEHFTSCGNCSNNSASRFLSGIHLPSLIMAAEDVIFLKKISKSCGNHSLEKMVDEYIVKKHRYVFCDYDFLQMEEGDFLKYVEGIDDECSSQEFSCIIEWIKQDESRHGAFEKLFHWAENSTKSKTSMFLASLSNIDSLARTAKKQADSDSDRTQNVFTGRLSWWPKDSLFLKSLAQKFGFTTIEAKLDSCIIRDFSEVCRLHDFGEVSAGDLVKFISAPDLYLQQESVIWNAVKLWVKHDSVKRTQVFPRLLDAMLLHKFSTKFLRQRVIRSEMVKNSNSSLVSIVTILLDRIQILEDSNSSLSCDMDRLKEGLNALKEQFEKFGLFMVSSQVDVTREQRVPRPHFKKLS